MEFMLSEALPIYSGGLGNVAGDQLKAASDLGLPVVGVGLLYQQGYFRQVIDKDGAQQALFPFNDPGQLPISPLRQPNGEWLRLEIALPGYSVWLRAWQVQVGRVKLYLLDTNDAANYPAHRGITSELYGGGPELRLKQELLLGIGGWRLLEALNVRPQVCHLNEGHAAFAVLERARSFMEETGQPFEVALAVTRAGNIFTTHTAVAAGFDCFAPSLIERIPRRLCQRLGIPLRRFAGLGPAEPGRPVGEFQHGLSGDPRERLGQWREPLARESEPAYFCRLCFRAGRKTKCPWAMLPTESTCRPGTRPRPTISGPRPVEKTAGWEPPRPWQQDIRRVPDARLWQLRNSARKSLVEYARRRLSQQLAASGASDRGSGGGEPSF